MFILIIIFLAGILLLWKGAIFLVNGSSGIARWFGTSALVVGLTVAAMGTSFPELIVSLTAVIKNSGDLSIGNIVGSNIANILLILGIAAIIRPLQVGHSTIWREIPFSLLAIIMLAILANDFLNGNGAGYIGRNDGLVLLVLFVFYIVYIIWLARQKVTIAEKIEEFRLKSRSKNHHPLLFLISQIILGLLFLFVGGYAVVYGGTGIARLLGISEMIVGLTIVAIGTSLPELATSTVAAYRGKSDIAIGNIIGSNIFNILFVLGVVATVKPIFFSRILNMDIVFVMIASILLFGAILFLGRKFVLTRANGFTLIFVYICYLFVLIYREFGRF